MSKDIFPWLRHEIQKFRNCNFNENPHPGHCNENSISNQNYLYRIEKMPNLDRGY